MAVVLPPRDWLRFIIANPAAPCKSFPFIRGPWSVVRCRSSRSGAPCLPLFECVVSPGPGESARVSEPRTTDHGPRTKTRTTDHGPKDKALVRRCGSGILVVLAPPDRLVRSEQGLPGDQ